VISSVNRDSSNEATSQQARITRVSTKVRNFIANHAICDDPQTDSPRTNTSKTKLLTRLRCCWRNTVYIFYIYCRFDRQSVFSRDEKTRQPSLIVK